MRSYKAKADIVSRFISNRPAFDKKHATFLDILMGHMAMDIEINIKTETGTPVKTGDMKAETRHFRTRSGGYRVESVKEYAAYQERGARRDGSHVVKNYTTAGTGPHWFQKAIDMVLKNRITYIDVARKAAGF